MDEHSSTLDHLFDDLNLELELPAPAPPPKPSKPGGARGAVPFHKSFTELAAASLDRLAPASVMLTENDPVSCIPTRPYEVPVEELFGDANSSLQTVPVPLGDLPDEAWPTELTFTALW